MSKLRIDVSDTCSDQDRDAVLRGLVGYNELQAPGARGRDIHVLAHDDAGETVAGLIGHTHWNWMFVKILWVSESCRGQGLGKRMLEAAEKEAIARGCRHVHLDTFSFQALPFYQSLGYTIFGQLEDYPEGHTRYFLQKRNLS